MLRPPVHRGWWLVYNPLDGGLPASRAGGLKSDQLHLPMAYLLTAEVDFTAVMQTWAVVEDLPEVVNAEVGDAIEELTQLTLIHTPCCCCAN